MAVFMSGLVDCFGFQCQACAGLNWAYQGRYRNKLERSFAGVLASIYGQSVSLGPAPISGPARTDSTYGNHRLRGKGQTLEGDLEETSLTTKSRWGIEPVFASALSRPRHTAIVAQR